MLPSSQRFRLHRIHHRDRSYMRSASQVRKAGLDKLISAVRLFEQNYIHTCIVALQHGRLQSDEAQ